MSHEQAAGAIGSIMVETGSQDLMNLDVVEKDAKAGRGMMQYTGPRRVAYDRARTEALRSGADPNSMAWQIKYMAEEYKGKHDPAPGKSLVSWSKPLEKFSSRKYASAAEAAKAFTGSAASGQGYLRPGKPHFDKRMSAAESVARAYAGRGALEPLKGAGVTPQVPSTPKPPQPLPSPSHGDPMGLMIRPTF
ncbi:hypothetical protein P60_gp47 [Synechococcus phage P60]|uniref:Phage tail lysozyme domain-containing protein n=1 Tax=Synechococcus phage P60 TaxID=2905923 RepID=L0CQ17_9CAUD|nr:hypothetical protein P60_gp47 [Synechococcus phage P60]AGA17899.1 hypothetical protein P60_gp47 [Synechococcus phage P60]